MKRIVAIGECMVEMAPTNASGEYRLGFAGDTMNTAWYLRRLMDDTDQVDYLTAVGMDAASDQMLAFLRTAGLGTEYVTRLPDRTVGLYLIQLDEGERSFSYWRGQSAARMLAQSETALADALHGADVVYFSGITLGILAPEDRVKLLRALANTRATGATVVFDPNLRPKLWASTDEMTAQIMQAAKVSDVVLPSHEDEAEWFGDADVDATADRYAQAGAQTILVKNGPGQMLALVDGQRSLHTPDVVRKVIDTTAAGDSFNAGYLAAMLNGQTTAQAVKAGADLASKVIQSRGALVPCT